MFGAHGGALDATSRFFLSPAASRAGVPETLGLRRPCQEVADVRGRGKRDLPHNDALPRIEVDPETYEVRADGALLACEPLDVLPLAQRYFLF
jgi:urease subunit alpha